MATKSAKLAKTAERESILDYFAELPDPRRDSQNKRHKLIDIIAISILATICGAEHFTEMEVYAEANEEFLKTILELPNGIPLMTHSVTCMPELIRMSSKSALQAGLNRSGRQQRER